jgi:hypothetical protein
MSVRCVKTVKPTSIRQLHSPSLTVTMRGDHGHVYDGRWSLPPLNSGPPDGWTGMFAVLACKAPAISLGYPASGQTLLAGVLCCTHHHLGARAMSSR